MTNSTQVLVKMSQEVRPTTVSFQDVFVGGETMTSGVIGTPSPAGVTVTVSSTAGATITLNVSGGASGQSYGVPVSVNTTGGHIYTKVLAVVINDNIQSDFQNQNEAAFNQIVGKLEAGTSGLGRANFMFPAGFDGNTGLVSWELIDQNGALYGSGQAFDYQINTAVNGVRITAQAVIGAPSEMLPTLSGQAYQIRWTLSIQGQSYYTFENLEITSDLTVPVGCEDLVEMAGTPNISVRMVSESPYDSALVTVYYGNDQVLTEVQATSIKVANGWEYSAQLPNYVIVDPTMAIPASLEPYSVVWSMSNAARPNFIERQFGRLFIVNASMMSAVEDMRIVLSKARTSILGTQDILFTEPLLLAYLRRARDEFNIAWGMFTGFTMMNARGGIRELWLKFAQVLALRSQFLAEGEKVFNFSGQAISLDVDRTQYYDSLANTIQQDLDSNGKAIKQNLIKKGIIGGDGNEENLQIGKPGHLGTVGISISPATNWTRFVSRYGTRWGNGLP